VTRPPGKPYGSPSALRAGVVARANTAAKANQRFTVQQLLRQFAYARLLARVFTLEPESWVLKGGVSLLARLPGARHSLDIDLWGRQQSLAEAEQALELASAVDLGDFASFDIGAWSERRDEEARPLAQATVHCSIGVRKFVSFGVDLVGGPFPALEPEPAPPLRPLDIPGLRDAPLGGRSAAPRGWGQRLEALAAEAEPDLSPCAGAVPDARPTPVPRSPTDARTRR